MDLLISRESKYPPFHEHHEKNLVAGNVIDVCADGWPWSDADRAPDRLIINAPITPIEAEALTEGARLGEKPRLRRLGLNIEGLSTGDVLTRAELVSRIW